MATQLLKKRSGLAETGDQQKTTPLHFATYYDKPSLVERLVNLVRTLDYKIDYVGTTPLHIAARQGHLLCIILLVTLCPDCYEMVNRSGPSALHMAAANGKNYPAEYSPKNPMFSSLIKEGDNNGDTQLHLLAGARKYIPSFFKHPKLEKKAKNDKNSTALDILQCSPNDTVW